jgi:predicted nucleic acid-binding protein
MTYSSSLDNVLKPLVLDTSVLINLHASTYGKQILTALPNDILVPRIVVQELERGTNKSTAEELFVQDLVASGDALKVEMNDQEYQLFGRLASESPTLGDGEAATIAISACRELVPVVDEKRGRVRAQANIPDSVIAWSLDLFLHGQVVKSLGDVDSTQGLYLALRDGRMRIHPDHCEPVVRLIGPQRALACFSLPNFKTRRTVWEQEASHTSESTAQKYKKLSLRNQ